MAIAEPPTKPKGCPEHGDSYGYYLKSGEFICRKCPPAVRRPTGARQ